MGDKLDFSKLLAWELLLAVSSVNNVIEAGNIAVWNRDQYINTIVTISDKELEEYKEQIRANKPVPKIEQLKNDKKTLEKHRGFICGSKAFTPPKDKNLLSGGTTAHDAAQAHADVAKEYISKAHDAVQPHADVAKQLLHKAKNKAKERISNTHKKIRGSKQASGTQFKATQNKAYNLIYLENAIDDGAREPSANTEMFEGPLYNKHQNQLSYIISLEEKLQHNSDGELVNIVNEFYGAIDPQTLTYLNKLIATSIPLINQIKLYIFLASLMPDFSTAFSAFITNMNSNKQSMYTTELNNNMRGLFYKHRDVLRTKREESIQKSKKRTKQLTESIKRQVTPTNNIP